MKKFSAHIDIIGINPFVFLPDKVLTFICKQAGREKGPIRVRGTINGQPYRQSLVRFQGAWRLYINGVMLKNSPKRIGEKIQVTIEFDPEERTTPPHPRLIEALRQNKEATASWDKLTPSRQWEIIRYIGSLKTDPSIDRNITRAILHLTGKGRFVGRD